MPARKNAPPARDLFRKPGQTEMFDKSVEEEVEERMSRAVECLGMTFPNDQTRRDYFQEKLRKKLADPEFRKIEGFPIGKDEDILRMSDPPYYTACPNPFLEDFVRVHGRPYDPAEPYHRDPFAVDTSVGKTDPLYKAHSYHTKVPHLAIVPSILHYTKPGDIVLDGFCGSGMTGVAAQWCGAAPIEYRKELELRWKEEGRSKPEWGARRVILNDLGPAATFISAGYNLPFDVMAFQTAAQRILDKIESEFGWMYATAHKDGRPGRINFTVWSEVFSCPECSGEVVFVDEALNRNTGKVSPSFPCPHCGSELTKDALVRLFETSIDPATKKAWKRIKLKPVLINYSIARHRFEKKPDEQDLKTLSAIAKVAFPAEAPSNAFPLETMYHGSRLGPKGFTHVHHLFDSRTFHVLALAWREALAEQYRTLSIQLRFWVDSQLQNLSIQNRYRPQVSFPYNPLSGVYYVSSAISEADPHTALANKSERMQRAFERVFARSALTGIATASCAALGTPDQSVDYIFTVPPFGSNIPYADLNFVPESWHRVWTNSRPEAIIDGIKNKGLPEYQELMRRCFAEYYRILKPGRWMTVVFSNSSNAVWRAIQEAMGRAGFVAAAVRTLDKQQGSYRQETSSAVKQDLVISAYKPTETVTAQFKLGKSSEDAAWALVREFLSNVPRFIAKDGTAEVIAERTAQVLLDRVIAYHVQHELSVPISAPDFFAGLASRFPQRDGMYFLPDQVAEYDKKRAAIEKVKQIELSVNDEASAIVWLRNELTEKPRSFQDLQPEFMRELHAWVRHERTVELKEILQQNFLVYDGKGPVPPQIHSYLSSNMKDLRKLDKNDPDLKERAVDRWYVPDPNKQGDLDKVRDRALLKEFESYRESKERKLKVFRTEAIRAGFKAAYDAKEYGIIVELAQRLPENVLQEDEKLLMYYDVASTRIGEP